MGEEAKYEVPHYVYPYGIVMEANEKEEEDEQVISKYKNTGSKRTFLLAEVQGVPENRNNYEIVLKSLNFSSLAEDTQTVSDLKVVSILLAIQTASSMHGCPYCESYKTNTHHFFGSPVQEIPCIVLPM